MSYHPAKMVDVKYPQSGPTITEPVYDAKTIFHINTHTSYILIWLSSEPVTSSWESGEKHRERIGFAWPESGRYRLKCV